MAVDNSNFPIGWRRRLAVVLPALALFVIVLSVFAPALKNGFVDWDDPGNFLNNPDYRGLGWSNIKWMFTTFHMGHYQPLTWLTLGYDAVCGEWLYHNRVDPRPYHFTNNLLHAANAVLFYFVALRLIGWRRSPENSPTNWAIIAGAAFAALLFGVHPLRVESVAWITERRDLLSGLFALLTILAYLQANQPGQFHRRRWLMITFALFVCVLLGKVIGVTLPVVMLVLDWHPLRRLTVAGSPPHWLRRENRIVLLEKIPFLAIALVFSSIASIGQQRNQWLMPLDIHPPIARLAQACYGLCFYLEKNFLPLNLLPLYQMRIPLDINQPRFIIAAILVCLAAAAIVVLLKANRLRAVSAAALAYAVLLLPVLGFVQNGQQIVADRYSYLSCMGWAVIAGAGLATVWRRKSLSLSIALAIVAIVSILALIRLTERQILVWRSTESLWWYTVTGDPGSSFAQNSYGFTLLEKGIVDEAIPYFRRAIELQPDELRAHQNLWNALLKKGDGDSLLAAYRSAARVAAIEPKIASYGEFLIKDENWPEALAHYRAAVQLDQASAQTWTNLGYVLVKLSRRDEAIEAYRKAVVIDPNLFQARYNLGVTLKALGHRDEAQEHLKAAVRLKPDHAGAKTALQQLTQTP